MSHSEMADKQQAFNVLFLTFIVVLCLSRVILTELGLRRKTSFILEEPHCIWMHYESVNVNVRLNKLPTLLAKQLLHMTNPPDVEAEITLLTEGGRQTGVFSGYRPAHKVKDDYLTTGVHHYISSNEVKLERLFLGPLRLSRPKPILIACGWDVLLMFKKVVESSAMLASQGS